MNINNKKKTFLLIGILVLTMLIVSGGTFAYFRWISSEDQQTNLAIQIEENISMHIENPALEKTGMYPTNTCTNVAATMSGVSIIALENQTGVIARPKFKLRVKITDKDGNVITNNSAGTDNGNNPYRYFINYAVSEENGTCTEPLYSGNFDQNEPTYQGQTQWYDSEWITLMNETTGFPLISNGQDSGVSFNGTPYQTTYHNYKVWVWIDESYVSVNTGDVVSDKLQDAKIELSWSENSTVQQIKAQAYAVFSSSEEGGDDSLRFYQSDEPITEDSTYAGRPVTNVYTGFETESYNDYSEVPWYSKSFKVKTLIVEDVIAPISTAYWFREMYMCSYLDVTKLDTSNVTDMNSMFSGVGRNAAVTTFAIEGMENWDTSNVTNMRKMFDTMATNATTFNISDISDWNVSNVTDMYRMFFSAGILATNDWSLDLSKWNVYKVTNYDNFENSDNIIPPNWYTSYALAMSDGSLRFYRTSETINRGDIHNGASVIGPYQMSELTNYTSSNEVPWGGVGSSTFTSVVVENEIYPTSTAYWFHGFTNCLSFDLENLNTSNVTNMSNMFLGAGISAGETLTIEGMENWDTSNVTDMSNMFYRIGSNIYADGSGTKTINIGNLSKWNTSKVTDMHAMFHWAGVDAVTLYLTGLENWNTSNVVYMYQMFSGTGQNATNFYLDLSNWNVSSTSGMDHGEFNLQVEDKVIAPNWIN